MTTQISVVGNFSPDVGVYLSKLTAQMSLTNVKNQFCWVFVFPTGADLGGELSFIVPQNYASAPVLILDGVIDGTPANTLGVGAQLLQVAASATIDAAYEAEDTASNATWTGYADEEGYQIAITLTPSSAFVAGNKVFIKVYRDNSVDDTTWDFLVTDILFQYTEA
jgi:hypothetical protein